MLTQITSLTRNGLKDWYLQRVSAVVLVAYILFLTGYIFGHHPIGFEAWYAVFHHTMMKAFTVLALIALIIHAWIGMWTVFTDYITCKAVRLVVITLMILSFMVYFVWAIEILWG
jgi:succinate dehydrogenase / fumarate reductase membrane anchor subunit